jgi:hypothetical protein
MLTTRLPGEGLATSLSVNVRKAAEHVMDRSLAKGSECLPVLMAVCGCAN